jgi:PAS domain S-box-containing protein
MAKAQILIVENDSIVAKDIKRTLKNQGFAVPSIASSGAEAFAKIKENSPDLVLMDILLKKEMDGIEAANQIRSQYNIPVVYLTAFADEKVLERAKITEPFGYIIKPFVDRELHSAIQIALYKHKMEKDLKESEQWLSIILRSIGDGVIVTNTRGEVTFMNPVAGHLTGWNQEEAIGKSLNEVFNIINEKTGKQIENPATKVIQGERTSGTANHSALIAKDGMEIPIDENVAPIRDEKGGTIGVVLVFRDVSEKREAEEALRKTHDELEIRVKERTAELLKINALLRQEIEERKRTEEALQRSEVELRRLPSRILEAHEEESKRIGQELHDGLAQTLSAIKVWVEAALMETGQENPPEFTKSLESVIRLAQEAVEEVRRISKNLRPSILDDLGILATISWLCQEFETIYSSIDIQKEIDIEEDDVYDSLKIVIFRVLQEALNNIAKHSRATLVRLSLKKTDGRIELTIDDNGKGFDVEHLLTEEQSKRGLGLDSMKERSVLSGGAFSIESNEGAGTIVRVSWES